VRDMGDVSSEETVAAGGRSWLVVGLVERQEGSVGVWCCGRNRRGACCGGVVNDLEAKGLYRVVTPSSAVLCFSPREGDAFGWLACCYRRRKAEQTFYRTGVE